MLYYLLGYQPTESGPRQDDPLPGFPLSPRVRKRLRWLGLIAILLIVEYAILPPTFRQVARWWRISEASFARIELGMNWEEVEAILGEPNPSVIWHHIFPGSDPPLHPKIWMTDKCHIMVGFNDRGLVS